MEKGSVGWGNSKWGILEEQVDDFHQMGNRELEEHHVNNEFAESQLEYRQYKLAHQKKDIVEKDTWEL